MSVVSSEGLRRGSFGQNGLYKRRRRPSNHEERPSLTTEARRNTFGIYRSVAQESHQMLGNLIKEVVGDSILPEISKNRSPFCLGRFVVKDQIGVTYLRHSQMRQKAVQKELRNNEFKLRLERDQIIKEACTTEELEVGINLDHFEWMDDQERSLAIFLDHGSEGYAQLVEEQAYLTGVLGRYSPALASRIKDPDHVKVLKYGQGKEINQLSQKEKNFCIEKIATEMQDNGFISTVLEPVIFGKNYSEPVPAWQASDSRQLGGLALSQ